MVVEGRRRKRAFRSHEPADRAGSLRIPGKNIRPDWAFAGLTAFASASLFVGVKEDIGGAQLRPFDGIVALVTLWALLFHGTRFLAGLRMSFKVVWPLLAAYSIRSLNALLTYGEKVALVEAIQATELFVLTALIASTCQSKINRKCYFVFLTSLLALIGVATLAYVASQGEIRNLKELTSPRYVFGLVSLFLIGGVLSGFFRMAVFPIVFTCLWLPILLLSAERSAWVGVALVIGFHVMIVMVTSPKAKLVRRAVITSVIIIIAIGSIWTVASFNETIDRQISRLYEPIGLIDLSKGRIYYYEAESPSNQSRLLQLDNVARIFKVAPFFGVGTNGFIYFAYQHVTSDSVDILQDIHGEFWLLLSENGLVAVVFVLLFWVLMGRHFGRLGLFSRMRPADPPTKIAAYFFIYSIIGALTIGAGSVNLFLLYLPAAMVAGILLERGHGRSIQSAAIAGPPQT